MKMIRLNDEVEERLEHDKIESMQPDLVQRIQGANGQGCPLQTERRIAYIRIEPCDAIHYKEGEGYIISQDGCCMLKDQNSDPQQCYVARGYTTKKEACPVYLRVIEQLGL